MSKASFNWEDPLLLDTQLTEDERMIRDAARAKRAAVAARRAAAAADTSLGLHMGAGGAYVPRVTLLLAGAEAPRRSRVRTAAAAAAANSGPISTIGLL